MKQEMLSKSHLIIPIGIPGAGKSYFAEHFANTFKSPMISFEQMYSKLFSTNVITKDQRDKANLASNYLLNELLKTHSTTICDYDINKHSERANLTKIATSMNYKILFIWVQTDKITAKKRLHIKSKSSEFAKLRLQNFDKLVKEFNQPNANERSIVLSGKHSFSAQLKIVLEYLAKSTN